MATSRSKRPTTTEELARLREALDRLTDHVQCLTSAVDELRDEVEWRNRNLALYHSPISRGITSISLDPAAEDFRLNAVPAHVVERLRAEVTADKPMPSTPTSQAKLFD